MSSPVLPVRRRQRLEFESDEDHDDSDTGGSKRSESPSSRSSKRARAGEHSSEAGSLESATSGENYNHLRKNQGGVVVNGFTSNLKMADNGQYQPGAIVRVEVTNFVTYEKAAFYPGPNLNMVIGPNGTGKSSLVCAICLGLGYGPAHLGRAGKVGEFVKHGYNDATIEIELQRRPEDTENTTIRVKIIRDGDKRKWWINDTETSLKNVQMLTREFGIQVDNLCQFLPQDRVSEFAGLNPIELLHHTQRAAAPEEMLVWHDELKALRKDQKSLQLQYEADQETLKNLESRQEGLRADVERLQERAKIQERIVLLEKSVPFLRYSMNLKRHREQQQLKKEAQRRLKELERQVEPTLRSVNAKQEYQGQVRKAVQERKMVVQDAERAADAAVKRIEEVQESITKKAQKKRSEIESEKKRKQDLQKIQTKIRELEAWLQNAPPPFNGDDWNSRIRAKEHRVREIDTELRSIATQEQELVQRAKAKRRQIGQAEQDLAGLESQAGQQVNKLKQISAETCKAWEWIQENMNQFEKPVYGPPIVECSVKDPRYADAIESLFQSGDFLSLTTVCKADFEKLSDQVYKNMKLADISIRCVTESLADVVRRRPNISEDRMAQLGFDGWASDFIDGPEPVVTMLCLQARIHLTGIALKEISESQYNMIVNSPIQTFVTARAYYRINTRREYGPGATSTTTRIVAPGTVWTNQPVDLNAKQELQERIREWTEEFEAMREEADPLKAKVGELKIEKQSLMLAASKLRNEKNEAQNAAGQYEALPARIAREKESLRDKDQKAAEFRQSLNKLNVEAQDLTLEKTTLALEHKRLIEELRACHEAHQEAEARLIEAASDVEALTERNRGVKQSLADERQLVEKVTRESQQTREAASESLRECQAIIAEEDDDGPNVEYFKSIASQDLTIEALEHDIEAERSKLEFIHDNNPGALKEFETRQITIQKLGDKIQDSEKRLEKLNRKITRMREKWEPELDKLIGEISEAFAYNFEQIGCAGEVSVHKDDDFDLWSIEIKVKFRENETLQLLDQHRQSGGERSVSTIFYLMSLQSLARAPFRVVDEINQGMDPRNERMVHERMVEIACKEHTSQYFLITPKLLTGLKYDPRMKVLCIASGEYMPKDHTLLDIERAIKLKRVMAIPAAG